MKEGTSDIIVEGIEVFINSVLHIRQLYPSQIFEKRKIYNTPIYVSIYPPLNDYILNILKSIKELINNHELSRIEVVIYKDDMTIYESYVFEIDDKNPALYEEQCNRDKYLIDFEEQLRKSLITLEDRVKILGKLPDDAKFKVNLQTTQSAFVKFSNNSCYQRFPWLQETENILPNKSEISILPITAVDSVGLLMYAKKY